MAMMDRGSFEQMAREVATLVKQDVAEAVQDDIREIKARLRRIETELFGRAHMPDLDV